MKSILDRKLVTRRAKFANLASIGGMLLLLVSVVLPMYRPELLGFAQVLLFVGMGAAMVGIYFANRWVKKPRPEDVLDKELKSLSNSHRLYHYPRLPCDHLLLAPYGLVVLEAVNLAGEFSYSGGRWRERISMGRALRYIVEEHLGDPIKAARSAAHVLGRRLVEAIPGGEAIPIHAVVVFSHPAVHLEVTGEPLPVCRAERLARRLPASKDRLSPETYDALRLYLDAHTSAPTQAE